MPVQQLWHGHKSREKAHHNWGASSKAFPGLWGKSMQKWRLVNLSPPDEYDEDEWSVPTHPFCSLVNLLNPNRHVKRTSLSSLNPVRMHGKWQHHLSVLIGFIKRSEMLWKPQKPLCLARLVIVYLSKQTAANSNHRLWKFKPLFTAQQRKTWYMCT